MGFAIPKFIESHDELLILEMQVVKPPFIVDFAAAYLDRRPPFSDQQMEEIEQDRMEMFGEDWPVVESILATLRGIGVHLADVKPGNITFR